MRTTIDKAGRLVVPKELRDRIGLRPGQVDVEVDGATLRIAPVAGDRLVEHRGRLVVPADRDAPAISDDDVRALRDADRR